LASHVIPVVYAHRDLGSSVFCHRVRRRIPPRTDPGFLARTMARKDRRRSLRGAAPSYGNGACGAMDSENAGTEHDFLSLAAMGLGALLLQQLADFAVGIGLRGMTAAEQFAYLRTPAGLIYLAALVTFAAMPVLVH
jgi:hypothetical protein